jgi:hypothetical protein
MSKRLSDDIDIFIDALEEMIDALDDAWEEEHHHNYRERERIRETRYKPAREKVKNFLLELINSVDK